MRRRLASRAALPLAALCLGPALALVACSTQVQNGYVQSSDGALSFRHPSEWTNVGLEAITTEWVEGVDAAGQPTGAHSDSILLDQPFVVAQVYNLSESNRDKITQARLRTLALTDGRDPKAGDDPAIRLIFHETYLDDAGFEGHHMRFEVDLADGTAVEEHFATLDPDRKQVLRVRAACSQACFEAYQDDIESLFASVQLRS